MMIPFCASGGGEPHETSTLFGPVATTRKFVGGLLGPIIEDSYNYTTMGN